MSRIQQEPQRHIHDRLVSELTEMSIRIKLSIAGIEQGNNPNRSAPTWQEVNDLLEQCRDEMNACTQPYKLHR